MDLRITYTHPNGEHHVVTPAPAFRQVSAVTVAGKRMKVEPICSFEEIAPQFQAGRAVTVDSLKALKPEWAETEEEFAKRIIAKDVPADATDVKIVHISKLEGKNR